MEVDLARQRQQAHSLLDVLPSEKLVVVRSLLEVLVDPLARALANAPYDDEPVSDEEIREIAESRALLARGEGVPMEEVLADFDLTSEDFERMGRSSLEAEVTSPASNGG